MANITHAVYDVSERPVGHGGFSDIYTGIWSSPNGALKVAVKVVRASPTDFDMKKVQHRLEKEIRVWKNLSHTNVQILSGLYEGIGPLPALVSPWCKSGNIQSFVSERASDPNINPAELDRIKLNLLIDVMSGVQFLHDNHIIHGDIKGANILISDRGAPLVCDFGLSSMIAELSESSTRMGTPGTWRWMAPELFLDERARPSCASDIWACGCLFIEVWSSIRPYHSKKNQQQLYLAFIAGEAPYPACPGNMPNLIWSQVQECCNFKAIRRPRPSWVTRILRSIKLSPTALRSSIPLASAGISVAWLPDGQHIVVGLVDGEIRVINSVTTATRLHLVGHTKGVNQVAVSPNGTLLASCSDDKSIRLWHPDTGLAIGPPMLGHMGVLNSVAFSPDGGKIVSGSDDYTIRVWSTATCTTVLGPLRGHTVFVSSVAYSPDGSRIVSGSWDTTVRVWNARTGDPIATLCGHTAWIRSVAYSPDGVHIVSGSLDCTIRIWDATTGQQVGRPLEGQFSVWSVAYSPDGTCIISSSSDNTIRLWSGRTNADTPILGEHTDTVSSVAFSPYGDRFASVSRDCSVCIWDTTEEWASYI